MKSRKNAEKTEKVETGKNRNSSALEKAADVATDGPARLRDWLWNDTIQTIFYAFLIAIAVRIVAFEPFNIPSGSMYPTLLEGDYLFVSKYTYGYSRYSFPFGFPPFSGRIWESPVERGDVAVFRKPPENEIDYIKRIVGLPGDRIDFYNKTLFVNGEKAAQDVVGRYPGTGPSASMYGASLRREALDDRFHDILVQSGYPSAEGKAVVPNL